MILALLRIASAQGHAYWKFFCKVGWRTTRELVNRKFFRTSAQLLNTSFSPNQPNFPAQLFSPSRPTDTLRNTTIQVVMCITAAIRWIRNFFTALDSAKRTKVLTHRHSYYIYYIGSNLQAHLDIRRYLLMGTAIRMKVLIYKYA